MKCTFMGCGVVSDHTKQVQALADGIALCPEHREQFESAQKLMVEGNPKPFLSVWVKAQGGAEAAAQRMKPQIDATARLLGALMGRAGEA